jgi:Domain of unknown function (DUF4281)
VSHRSGHQHAWTLVNLSTVPVWLAMILAPRSPLTRWMADRLVPLHGALGVVYTGSLVAGATQADERIDFLSMKSVQRALQEPSSMLAAWTHYISFDLFVGRWIWEQSLEEGKPARLSLLLTWWAGPMGLTTYLARRRLVG